MGREFIDKIYVECSLKRKHRAENKEHDFSGNYF